MTLSVVWRMSGCFVLLLGGAVGCAGLSDRHEKPQPPPAQADSGRRSPAVAEPIIGLTAAWGDPPSNPSLASEASELTADAVVAQVLANSPTLTQMVAAWQAASARYPQVTSLDDPMLGSTLAPAAVGQLGDGNRGYAVNLSQKFPWPGKLALRGENAKAQADAAGRDVEDTKQELVEAARVAFAEYYLVARATDVNAESIRLLKEFRENAETRYKTGMAPQQDILQADVEIGRQRERKVTLERMREVAVARINTLSHLPPTSLLPPPPPALRPTGEIPAADALQAAAVAARPDLQALTARIRADQAAVALADREYYPDFRASAGYATFMDSKSLYPQVGLEVNLPLRLARRDGALAESQARLTQRRAELGRMQDQVAFQVREAAAQVKESERVVKLYEAEILPAAEANVKSAQTAYVTGKLPFLSLIEAQRNVVGLRDRYHEVVAGYFRRMAALERAVGGPVEVLPPVPSGAAPEARAKK